MPQKEKNTALQCRWTTGSDTSSAIQADNTNYCLVCLPAEYQGSEISAQVSPDEGETWYVVAFNGAPAVLPVSAPGAHAFVTFFGNYLIRFVSDEDQTSDFVMHVCLG